MSAFGPFFIMSFTAEERQDLIMTLKGFEEPHFTTVFLHIFPFQL